jgi:hypothetical protein
MFFGVLEARGDAAGPASCCMVTTWTQRGNRRAHPRREFRSGGRRAAAQRPVYRAVRIKLFDLLIARLAYEEEGTTELAYRFERSGQ